MNPIEIDEEDGKADYNDSQLYNSSMQLLIGSPDAPVVDPFPHAVCTAVHSLLNLNKEVPVSNYEVCKYI